MRTWLSGSICLCLAFSYGQSRGSFGLLPSGPLVWPDGNFSDSADVAGVSSATALRMQLPTFFFPVNRPGELENGPIESHRIATAGDAPEPEVVENSKESKLPSLLTAVYLFSAICFILCLRGLSTPHSAPRGNIIGMVGMSAAVLATFTEVGFGSRYIAFFAVCIPAAVLGIYIAHNVTMVQMPQLVALFHSFVGLAAMLVGYASMVSPTAFAEAPRTAHLIEIYVGELIAAITFSGSVVAAGKLTEALSSQALSLPGKQVINLTCVIGIVCLGVVFCSSGSASVHQTCFYSGTVIALALGCHLVASIGGADMPVVVSMLNSYSGFAAAASGFMLDNSLLIIAGCLIGASGAILSFIMCCGMNRSFVSVLLGGWEDTAVHSLDASGSQRPIQETYFDQVVSELLRAQRVVIVPGYGMASSRSQKDIANVHALLKAQKIDCVFAIHPVAGRMPGHMNVLLAEADVSYSSVKEMDEVNKVMNTIDVVIVLGANDIVNPVAMDPRSKIAGMPVIRVWEAKRTIIIKRSLAQGYASIENPLFAYPKTRMLFGDAKTVCGGLFARLSERAEMMRDGPQLGLDVEAGMSDSLDEEPASAMPKTQKVLGISQENGENNMVAMVPPYVNKLRAMAFGLVAERGAGSVAGFPDQEYRENGASVVDSIDNVVKEADVIVRVTPPTLELVKSLRKKQILISYVWPQKNAELLRAAQDSGCTLIAIDQVPRTLSRAQKVDVRTSMAHLQGYKAVIDAFSRLPKLSKASISAAGRVEAAQVLVVGAGIAGLQAIATARGLGAVVFATDSRAAAKEEVESCGGKWLELHLGRFGTGIGGYAKELSSTNIEVQRKLLASELPKTDVVITTAAVPGVSSPKLITTDMIKMMKKNSVVVDLATEFGDQENGWGGNCQPSKPNEDIIINGVIIMGRSRIQNEMPAQASELFSLNTINLLGEICGIKLGQVVTDNFPVELDLDLNNDILNSMVVVHNGKIHWNTSEQLERKEISPIPESARQSIRPPRMRLQGPTLLKQIIESDSLFVTCLLLTAILIGILGTQLGVVELQHLFLATLALIIGYNSVWSVTSALHTPLMSVTNALSGIIIVGAMLLYNQPNSVVSWAVMPATFFSVLNIFGGFYVTKRMLTMFGSRITSAPPTPGIGSAPLSPQNRH